MLRYKVSLKTGGCLYYYEDEAVAEQSKVSLQFRIATHVESLGINSNLITNHKYDTEIVMEGESNGL
jgi:hypothetical protein